MSEHPNAPNPEPSHFAAPAALNSRSISTYFSSMGMYPKQAWKAMIACGVAMMLSPAGVLAATTTFFVGPISKEFGWTESATLTLFSLPLLVVPFVLPFGGRWVDRWGVRKVAVPAVVFYGLTTAAASLVGASRLALGAILIVSMVFGYIGCVVVVFKVVLVWFPHHRGIGFASVGVVASLAGSVFSPLSEQLISNVGWRATFVLLGVAVLLVVAPAQMFLLSEPDPDQQTSSVPAFPEGGRDTGPVPAELPGVPLRKAVRSRAWLLSTVIFMLAGGAVLSVSQNAVSLLGDHGYSSETVSLSLSAQFISSVVGLILAGVILDRARSPWVIVPFVACVVLALVLVISVYDTVPVLFLAMCLLGVVRGAESTIGPYLIARYFGPRDFAQLQGLTLGITILAMGVIPVIVQTAAERTSGYNVPLLGLIVACAVALAMSFFLPRYPAPDGEPAAPSARGLVADRVPDA
ncbi:MFS transporter [Streptomyces maremycinicus]|uniref:MFS transporter n=1 Tax=Streptomyces maremycinicus TaxID=1679753 RepID=UPI000A86CD16|nr:MFS transporter [Streptomyces sp. NBRC 110468]